MPQERIYNLRLASDGFKALSDLKELAKTSKETDDALQRLAASSPKLASALDQSTARAAEAAVTHKAVSGSLNGLGLDTQRTTLLVHDMTKSFAELANGMPPMMVAFQHLGQAQYIFGSLGQAAKAVIGQIFSVRGGVIAVGAALAGMAIHAERADERLLQTQNTLRATRNDYSLSADTIEAVSKRLHASIGLGDARAAGGIIAASAGFDGSGGQLGRLITLSKDLSLAMGTDVPTAAKELATALNDPAAAAQKLADGSFRSMTQALANSIKLQAEAGDKAGAAARVIDAYSKSVSGANESLTPFDRSLRNLSDAFNRGGRESESFIHAVGTVIVDAAAHGIDAITALLDKLDSAYRWAKDHGPSDWSGTRASPVLTSSTGRLGMFQVDPRTAADVGVSAAQLARQDTNIQAGLAYIQQLNSPRYGFQTQDQIAGAYNQGPTGYRENPGSAAGYISKINRANVAELPAGVAEQIEQIGQGLLLSPKLIELGQRIAMVESRGRQYGDADAAAPLRTSGRSDRTGGPFDPSASYYIDLANVGRQRTQTANDAYKSMLSLNPLSQQIASNGAQQQLLQAGISEASSRGDADAVRKLSEGLAELKGKAAELRPEQVKLATSAIDATRALSAQMGATRDLATIDQKFAEVARKNGQQVDQQALGMARLAHLTQLASSYNDLVTQADRATGAQEKIAAAYDGTQASIDRATNQQHAYQEALKSFLPDSDAFTEAVARYSAALDRGTAASNKFTQLRNSVQDLSSGLSGAFDQVGNSLTQAVVQGQQGGIKFTNVLQAVDQQLASLIIKLSIINPLMNAIDGGTRGTASSLFGIIAKSVGSLFAPAASSGMYAAGDASFANGGIMTQFGPLPLRRYAGGGIANFPQAAVFGEGSTPEAYVPLPDGRSIPVKNLGGGGGSSSSFHSEVHVHVAGSSAGPQQLAQVVRMAVAQSHRELFASIERGGPAARAVGRRRF